MAHLKKYRIQTKIFADRDNEDVEKAANEFLEALIPDRIGSITHETKIDELHRLIYIIKINYTAELDFD